MGEIRIVSGRYRGRKIKTPEGHTTRPLLSRLRKSLVDTLRPRLQGARVLDLFGGSGAIGFELLSNGAESAVVCELEEPAARAIRENAARLNATVEVIAGDCLETLHRLAARKERFDLIIVAPPYNLDLQARAMETLARYEALLAPHGRVVIQRDVREPQWEAAPPFVLTRERTYGRTAFDHYEVGA